MSRILKKLIVPAVIIAILVISFVFGGSPDTSNETSVVTPDVQVFEEEVAEKPELPAPPEQNASARKHGSLLPLILPLHNRYSALSDHLHTDINMTQFSDTDSFSSPFLLPNVYTQAEALYFRNRYYPIYIRCKQIFRTNNWTFSIGIAIMHFGNHY